MSSSTVNPYLVPKGCDANYGVVTGPVESPVARLTEEQTQLVKELGSIAEQWGLTEEDKAFVDDLCLFRYLSGLKWDLKIAAEQLKETLAWRREYKPWNIRLKDVESVAKSGFLYHYGYDKQSRPIIYIQMGKDKTDMSEENKLLKFKFFVYIMEKCVARMAPGVTNILWIVDMKDSSLSLGVVKAMKDMFVKLGDYYTERLARCMMINVGWTLSLIWSFVKPFLAQETIDKYVIVKGGSKELDEVLGKYVDKSQLSEEYGGVCKYSYDFNVLSLEEQTEDAQKST